MEFAIAGKNAQMFVLGGENEIFNRWKKRSKVPQKIAQKNAQTIQH